MLVGTYDEIDLRKNGSIEYMPLPTISDENTRRLVIVNSILKTMRSEARDEVLPRKAAIIYGLARTGNSIRRKERLSLSNNSAFLEKIFRGRVIRTGIPEGCVSCVPAIA